MNADNRRSVKRRKWRTLRGSTTIYHETPEEREARREEAARKIPPWPKGWPSWLERNRARR